MSDAETLGFFAAMEPAARRETLERTRVVRTRKGQALLSKGDRSTDVFFILDGRLPVNTDGGCLANGEPVGASGLRQVYEVATQLQGRADIWILHCMVFRRSMLIAVQWEG